MEDGLIHRNLSEAIIGAAMKVLNELKPGLDEKLYENALVIELENAVSKWINSDHIRFIMMGS